jgi:NitT/TauT family transport system ATP-binding protein
MVQEAVILGSLELVRLHNVCKTYKPIVGGPVEVLRGISLSLAESEVLAIVGPSGCGKSTLLRLVAGLEMPTSGHIERTSSGNSNGQLLVGYVFQDSSLMRWRTVQNNIKLPLEILGKNDNGKVSQIIGLVGLTGFEKAYPTELSGGMQRRVAVARALVHEPSILLADEPFTGVDEITRETLESELSQLIRRLHVTCVLVTHDIEEAVYIANRVLVLSPRPGRIVREIVIPLPDKREPIMRIQEPFTNCCKVIREGLNMLPTDQ